MEKLLLQEVPNSSLPRERLVEVGEKALSNQELLAIILRTGRPKQNVMALAGDILQVFDNLYTLKQATLEDLMAIQGIGLVKAIEVKAAIELGRRIQLASLPKVSRIHSSYEIAQRMIQELKDLQQEHLVALFLDTKNQIIQQRTLFIGSLNQSIAHPREIFHWAVRLCAARILLCHNHRETRS